MILKTIKRIISGFICGMAIGNLIAIAFSYCFSPEHVLIFAPSLLEKAGSQANALALQTVLSGVYGAVGFGGMSFYEIEQWSLIKATVTHYVLILFTFILIGPYLGWVSLNVKDVGFMFILLTIAFFIIWLIMFLRYQAEVRELNNLLTSGGQEVHFSK